MRFRRVPLTTAFAVLMCFAVTVAPSAQTPVSAITKEYVGNVFILRGMWGNDHLHFGADGHPAKQYRAGSLTEAGFEVQSVVAVASGLRLEGRRIAFAFDDTQHLTPSWWPADSRPRMTIDIDGAAGQDYGAVLRAIMVPDVRMMASDLPACWQRWAHRVLESLPNASVSGLSTDAPGVKPPRVTYAVPPEDSDTRRRQYVTGQVGVFLVVDERGLPQHVAIEKPLGFGIDERVVDAVSHYDFKPATQNGKPVAVDFSLTLTIRPL